MTSNTEFSNSGNSSNSGNLSNSGNSSNLSSTENINKYSAERLYNTWLVDSIVFLSFSFLFLDAIKAKSINISHITARLISIFLLLINIIFTITAIFNYYINTRDLINQNKFSNLDTITRNVYLTIGVIYIFIQLFLFYILVKNTFSKN